MSSMSQFKWTYMPKGDTLKHATHFTQQGTEPQAIHVALCIKQIIVTSRMKYFTNTLKYHSLSCSALSIFLLCSVMNKNMFKPNTNMEYWFLELIYYIYILGEGAIFNCKQIQANMEKIRQLEDSLQVNEVLIISKRNRSWSNVLRVLRDINDWKCFYTKITEVNLSVSIYRLFHEAFT